MQYLAPFDVVKRSFEISTAKGQLIATAPYETLISVIKLLLSGVNVNEEWYCAQYPDVAKAVADGIIKSPKQHFIDNGYFEGRLPFPISVDDKWYLKQYSDVAESIKKGAEPSSQTHFLRDGYKEGRLPYNIEM